MNNKSISTNLIKAAGAIVDVFFTKGDGVSISEVGRQQAESKQANDSFWAHVEGATNAIFTQELSFVGSGGGASERLTPERLTVGEIRKYSGVADRSAQISTLMMALKLHKTLRARLEKMDFRDLVEETMPTFPQEPAPVRTGLAVEVMSFMDMDNIEEMIGSMYDEAFRNCGLDFQFFRKATELNSRAAVLGKLLSAQGAFFRGLVRPVPASKREMVSSGVVVTTWTKTYSEEEEAEFARLRNELQEEYNSLQRELNGYKKQLKDSVRQFILAEERRYQAELSDFQLKRAAYDAKEERIRSAAEVIRQECLAEMSALRIRVA